MNTPTDASKRQAVITKLRLSRSMISALKYYARLDTGEDLALVGLDQNPPQIGTRVALIDRGLLTAGYRNELTDEGRRAAYGLFTLYALWVDDNLPEIAAKEGGTTEKEKP